MEGGKQDKDGKISVKVTWEDGDEEVDNLRQSFYSNLRLYPIKFLIKNRVFHFI